MSEFWWGVLALPLILGAVAGAACLVFGAWLLIERWFERRWQRLEPIRLSRLLDSGWATMASTGQRGWVASAILAGAQARMLKLGPAALVIVWGKPERSATNTIDVALKNALTEVSKKAATDA